MDKRKKQSDKTRKTTRIIRQKRLLCVAGPTRRSSFGRFSKDLRGSRCRARDRVAGANCSTLQDSTQHPAPAIYFSAQARPYLFQLSAWCTDGTHLQKYRTNAQ